MVILASDEALLVTVPSMVGGVPVHTMPAEAPPLPPAPPPPDPPSPPTAPLQAAEEPGDPPNDTF